MPTDLGFKASPNRTIGRGKWNNRADMIVMHVTEGNNVNNICTWLSNPAAQASSHFITGQDGSYLQIVALENMAWCNGNKPSNINQALNATVKSRPNDNANLYTFSLENEGYSYKDRYGIPTDAQLEAIYEVCHKIADYILTYYPTWRASRQNVIGHCDIVSMQKPSCPSPNYGQKWPFDKVINNINSYIDQKMGTSTPIVIPAPTDVLNSGKSPVDTVAAMGIEVNKTMVKVKPGAPYYSGAKVPSWVYDNTYPVIGYSADRVVLGAGFNSPFNVRDLIVVNGETITDNKFTVGTYVKIKKGAIWNSTPVKVVPDWACNQTQIIDGIDNTNPNIVLLSKKGINSKIDVKYLEII